MIRAAAVVAALVIAAGASVQLVQETRYRLLASETIGSLLGSGESPATGVVFVFQPEDCLGNGEMIQHWNELGGAVVPVRARVVGSGTVSPEQERMFAELRVGVPVEGISKRGAAVVAERLGFSTTPFAVVLDRRGRVAAAFPADQNVPLEFLERMYLGTGTGSGRLSTE